MVELSLAVRDERGDVARVVDLRYELVKEGRPVG